TFTSLPAAAQHKLPWLPMSLVLSTRMDALAKIKDYHGPLLVSHGEADEVVPLKQGRQLFEAAPGPKRFVTVRGGRHNGGQPEEYRQALDEFLAQLPPVGSSAVRTASVNVE